MNLTLQSRLAKKPIEGPQIICSDRELLQRLREARVRWIETSGMLALREIDRLLDEFSRRRRAR